MNERNLGILLIPIGAFDYMTTLWAPDHARYRQSPWFRDYVARSGILDYWRGHGSPPRCKSVGNDDFEGE